MKPSADHGRRHDFGALVAALQPQVLAAGEGGFVVLPSAWAARLQGRGLAMDAVRPDPTAVKLARAYGLDPKRVTAALAQGRGLGPSKPGCLMVRCPQGALMDGGLVFDGAMAYPLPADPGAWLIELQTALAEALGWSPSLVLVVPAPSGPSGKVVATVGAAAPTAEDWDELALAQMQPAARPRPSTAPRL